METFLCGCDIAASSTYAMVEGRDGKLTSMRFDREGYRICPEHGWRRYGWRQPLVQGEQQLRLDFSAPDKRDLRDPETLGVLRLAAVSSSGTALEEPSSNGYSPEPGVGQGS